jgi:PKHD-type hydroxylase
MEVQPIFETKAVDLQNYYYFENGFNEEEVEKIIEMVSRLPKHEGVTANDGKANKSIRSSIVKWLPKHDGFGWLYFKLMEQAAEANKNVWNFDLYSVLDSIQYTEYHATENGHYGWHQDIGDGMMSKRKLSMVVQLSDPSEYEGGDLQYFRGGDPEKSDNVYKKKGYVFLFPSFMMHRVTPITKGVRKSLVLWLGGEHYR